MVRPRCYTTPSSPYVVYYALSYRLYRCVCIPTKIKNVVEIESASNNCVEKRKYGCFWTYFNLPRTVLSFTGRY